jgi:hypothetical protein
MSSQNVEPSDNNLLKRKQVSPLPVGPGGKNTTKTQLNQTNTQLTMMMAQATADTKYDPKPPQPISSQVIIEKFTNNNSIPNVLFIIGGLFIVYAFVSK